MPVTEAERQRQELTAQATILCGSNNPFVRERSQAILRKQEVDETIRSLKAKIGVAKSNAATRGVYMATGEFRALESRLAKAQGEASELQARLRELREKEKEVNRQEHTSKLLRFKKLVRECLDPDLFAELEAMSEADDDDSDAE